MKEMVIPQFNLKSDEKFVEEQLQAIKDDAEFYEIIKSIGSEEKPITTKVVKDNLIKIIDWRDDHNYCKTCPGIENCAKKNARMKLSLEFDGVILNRRYDPCERLLARLEQTTKYIYSDFPDAWRNCFYKDMDKDECRKSAVTRFSKIMSGEKAGLYLTGANSSGKSYVSVCLLNEYIKNKKDIRVGVIDTLTRFSDLSQLDHSYEQADKDSFEKSMKSLSLLDVLVLDGLGNEVKSDYIRDRILLPLLNERYKNHLPTIITSNYTMEEIAEMYSSNRKTNALHPSARHLLDLLKFMCDKECLLLSKLY